MFTQVQISQIDDEFKNLKQSGKNPKRKDIARRIHNDTPEHKAAVKSQKTKIERKPHIRDSYKPREAERADKGVCRADPTQTEALTGAQRKKRYDDK